MIAEGRVRLNEEVLSPPRHCPAEPQRVTVDSQPVKAAEPARLFLFQACGLITAGVTVAHHLHRAPCALPGTPADARSARPQYRGLLLTNDGKLKRARTAANGVPRTYRRAHFRRHHPEPARGSDRG